jgi:hypothetical protein
MMANSEENSPVKRSIGVGELRAPNQQEGRSKDRRRWKPELGPLCDTPFAISKLDHRNSRVWWSRNKDALMQFRGAQRRQLIRLARSSDVEVRMEVGAEVDTKVDVEVNVEVSAKVDVEIDAGSPRALSDVHLPLASSQTCSKF